MYELPSNIKAGDVILLDDGTSQIVEASYPLGDQWALDAGKRIVQCDPAVKIRVRKAMP